jgi:hypothetical protein
MYTRFSELSFSVPEEEVGWYSFFIKANFFGYLNNQLKSLPKV